MKHLPLLGVLTAAFIVFTANLGGYNLWPPDEPRFGQIAREMMQSGNPIALTINGEPYKEKPPFLFWLIALASLPFGDVTETSARIPSALAAIVAVYCTYRLAHRLYGPRTALAAGFVLITSGLFWWEARSVRTDMLLTGCLTASLYAFWMRHETKSLNWLFAFYIAVGAAVFAKGPPGVVFPLILAFTFYWGRRADRKSLHLGWGLLAITVLISLWLIPAYLMVPGKTVAESHSLGLWANLYRQTIGRFALGVSKARPPYFYFENLPLNLFPWTLFLPWTIWFAWKRRRENDAMRLLLCWIVPAIVFFSISSGKRAVYLLPLFPAIAILTGHALVHLADAPQFAWVRRTVGGIWSALLVAAGLAFPYSAYYGWGAVESMPDISARWPFSTLGISIGVDFMRTLSVLSGCALVFGLHALVTTLRRQGRGVHFAMAGHFAGIATVCALLAMPEVNAYKGASGFCAPLRHLSEAGISYRLYSVAFSREEYIFYAKHHHTDFLVYDWPLKRPDAMDPLEFVNQQRALGVALRKATDRVAIADWAHITDAEVEKLRSTSEGVFSFAKAKSPLIDDFKTAVGKAVQDFSSDVARGEATFLLVQEPDWRWLLPFAPDLRNLSLVSRASVGSDPMLLFANPAGVALLDKP